MSDTRVPRVGDRVYWHGYDLVWTVVDVDANGAVIACGLMRACNLSDLLPTAATRLPPTEKSTCHISH